MTPLPPAWCTDKTFSAHHGWGFAQSARSRASLAAPAHGCCRHHPFGLCTWCLIWTQESRPLRPRPCGAARGRLVGPSQQSSTVQASGAPAPPCTAHIGSRPSPSAHPASPAPCGFALRGSSCLRGFRLLSHHRFWGHGDRPAICSHARGGRCTKSKTQVSVSQKGCCHISSERPGTHLLPAGPWGHQTLIPRVGLHSRGGSDRDRSPGLCNGLPRGPGHRDWEAHFRGHVQGSLSSPTNRTPEQPRHLGGLVTGHQRRRAHSTRPSTFHRTGARSREEGEVGALGHRERGGRARGHGV